MRSRRVRSSVCRRLRFTLFCLPLLVAHAAVSGDALSESLGPNTSIHSAQSQPDSSQQSATRPDKSDSDAVLPLEFERHTDDLDAMVKRGKIRALVLYSRSGFFYVNGKPEGIYYEALQAFEQFINQKLHTRQHIQVTFIPVRPDQLESALTEGVGDIIAFALAQTSEREKALAFSVPIQTDTRQIVVTGKALGPMSSLADLGGKKVFVNPQSTYYGNLETVNDSLRKQGKPTILIEKSDPSLTDEDLMEMVNAGIIPATVTFAEGARLWGSVLPSVTVQSKLVVADNEDLAWAMRKNNPQLKAIVDQFVKTHAVGTSFGNTLVRRYLENNQWLKDPTTAAEMNKFEATVEYFKRYSSEFGFDYLMVVAQGYQESMLDQSARSPAGAVGIMQVMPSTAAAPPISIPDILTAENNIHAGVKLLNSIASRYFNDPKIDARDRLLLTFAAYNAGPNRIAELQKKAAAQGLNPNKWFENVELVVARDVGPVTVQYVSDIYKYYVAYKLVVEQGESLQ